MGKETKLFLYPLPVSVRLRQAGDLPATAAASGDFSVAELQGLLGEGLLVPCDSAEGGGHGDSQLLGDNALLIQMLDIFWVVMFSIMITIAIVGNVIVLWIVTGNTLNDETRTYNRVQASFSAPELGCCSYTFGDGSLSNELQFLRLSFVWRTMCLV